MKKQSSLRLLSLAAVLAAAGCLSTTKSRTVATSTAAITQTDDLVKKANAFLSTLSAQQKKSVQFSFDQNTQVSTAKFKGGMNGRMTFVGEKFGDAVWSNYPVSDVIRPGLRIESLSPIQQAAETELLKAVLSPKGFQKVTEIMGSDQALSIGETHFAAGRGKYTLAIFGEPDSTKPWMIEFGGHHLGLNIVIAGAHGSLTPTLTGAQPAIYQEAGKTVRVLAEENDSAFAFLESLNADQKREAILNYQIDDLVMGPGQTGFKIQPEGLVGSKLSDHQEDLLLNVVSSWSGILKDSYSNAHLDAIRASLSETYFSWSGPQTHAPNKNGTAYYRIQGPDVFIEFSPQGVGGDKSMHVHTIYRDPKNEYGRVSAN